MPIHILSAEVASQIAAGEVVERPASVVKELLENALDAGATRVAILVEKAGQRLVEVSDDGAGIPQDEMALAVERHATSKLRLAEELFSIRTLGFRGEALASIASVSRLTLDSRPPGTTVGARLRVEGGVSSAVEPAAMPAGTRVRVEDLFFNVPARLKFLKKESTERSQMDALVMRYALAYSHVRFHLVQDGKTVLQTSGNNERREVLASLYGVDTARQMLEVLFEDQDITVRGFISPVGLSRSNRREITFFINGRWVQDASLNTAMLQAYHTLLMVGRYPMSALFVELPPEDVDVNVHPAKAEVRFRNPDRVFSAVQRAVRRCLLAYSPVPQVVSPAGWGQASPRQAGFDPAWEMAGGGAAALPDGEPDSQAAGREAASAEGLPSGALPLLRLVGQVGNTYLVAEGPDGLYLIDQHAAHERVLFERLISQQKRGRVDSQALLEPLVLHLPPRQAAMLGEKLPILAVLGFDVESFGPATFRVRALPAIFTGRDPLAALRAVVEDFEEDETPLQAELEAQIAGRVCKRLAVKGGQTLSPDEQKALLRDLETCQSPRTCPHGRPTMIHLSVDLLERQFGRRGAR